jgi:hypothetical protein
LSIVSAYSLNEQLTERPEYDYVPDLYIGMNCPGVIGVNVGPEVPAGKPKGLVDDFTFFIPREFLKTGDQDARWIDGDCTRLVLFSHEPFQKFGGEGPPEARPLILTGIRKTIYAMILRIDSSRDCSREAQARLTRAETCSSFGYLGEITLPSHWVRMNRDTKMFRLYLQPGEQRWVLQEIANAFDDQEITSVARQPLRFEMELSGEQQITNSLPSVSGGVTRGPGGKLRASDLSWVINTDENQDSIFVSVRDDSVRQRHDVIVLLLSTVMAIGFTIVVDSLGKWLRRKESAE